MSEQDLPDQQTPRIAIIGGGPGGLFTAYLLQQCEPEAEVTVFEATDRLGGKVMTRQFPKSGATYEAGAAEFYDYSRTGPDPLRDLVLDLGLTTRPMEGPTVFFDGVSLSSDSDIAEKLGPEVWEAVDQYSRIARAKFSPEEYYDTDVNSTNREALSCLLYSDHLSEIGNATARRYIEIAAHSDVATEPLATSAMYGMHNWLMNFPEYMSLYSVDGGMERVMERLAGKIAAGISLRSPISRVERGASGTYRLTVQGGSCALADEFDFVVVALPPKPLGQIAWGDEDLRAGVGAHLGHYDYPAHYLRISLVFERPFWREHVSGSYFMIDEFGGCCVYDESLRDDTTQHGVLGWLLAGDAALTFAEKTDDELVGAALQSLPHALRSQCPKPLEHAVHRWIGSVNGWPMGFPIREPHQRHMPSPAHHPKVFLVGDYLYDSTINGALDSAEIVVDLISEQLAGE